MTNRDILEKAIHKAIDGGYKPDGIENVSNYKPTIRNGQAWVRWFNDDGQEVIQDAEHIIYNQVFAKSLWGEPYMMSPKEIKDAGYRGSLGGGMIDLQKGAGWQKHLQAMVVADDPIQYLGEHLDG